MFMYIISMCMSMHTLNNDMDFIVSGIGMTKYKVHMLMVVMCVTYCNAEIVCQFSELIAVLYSEESRGEEELWYWYFCRADQLHLVEGKGGGGRGRQNENAYECKLPCTVLH